MRLDQPLLKLPLRFDTDAIAAEMSALPADAWVPHPNKLPGNEAVRLVTTRGGDTDDTAAPMAPTSHLLASPYIMQVMAAIGGTWGRSRLMRLAAGSVVPAHVDTHYYWRTHVRLHVPIVTNPHVAFTCSGQTVHMAAGECWIFDTFGRHNVSNGGTDSRTHLVLDTVGGETLWELVEAARNGADARPVSPATGRPNLVFEQLDTSAIMSPWELKHHIRFIVEHIEPDPAAAALARRLDRFAAGWTGAWAAYGPSAAGVDAYRALLEGLERDLPRLRGDRLRLTNQLPVSRQLAELVFTLNAPLPPAAAKRAASA